MAHPPASERSVPRGAVLIGVGALALVGGVAFRSAAAIALGVALVGVPSVVRWLLGRALRSVVVTRDAPSFAGEGDIVRVRLILRRLASLPLFYVRVTDVFGPNSRATRTIEGPARLDRDRPVDLEYDVPCLRARGIYEVGPVTLFASDPFSWFTRSRGVLIPTEFKVYPRLSDPTIPERVVASFSDPQHAHRSLRAGDSDDFYAVRDFRPGDLLKRIHWPSTARRGFPVVKEFLPSVEREMVVFLDVSRELRFFGARLKNFESSVRFVASLSARAARAGFRIELRCGSGGGHDVSPNTGRGQYLRIVETLLHLRTRNDDDFTEAVARGLKRRNRSAVAVVVLHPYLVGNPALEEALARLVRGGFRVACMLYGYRENAYGPVTAGRHERALAKLKASGVELWSERS